MDATPTTRRVIQSDLTQVHTIQEPILRAAQDAGYSSEALFAIRLAVDEAVANAICHGNGSDPAKKVTIDYAVTDQQVTICVQDEGPGFCPDSLEDPTEPKNLCRPHGRGVLLIRSYMTEICFSDHGRCLTMIKARDCCKPQEKGGCGT